MVIDFHSHVLPKMDDGSKNTDMSLAMLEESRGQGVEVVVATPHFYGHRESAASFLERRGQALRRLKGAVASSGKAAGGELPFVLFGAEVAFFSKLTELDELDSLCINGTRTLLLEMPFAPWTRYELDAVSSLCLDRGYQVILAHLERFYALQKDEYVLENLLRLPLWVQVNAGALLPLTRRGPWIRLFREGRAHLLGSDCHDLAKRPPNLAAGRGMLRRKAGEPTLARMDELGARLLGLYA